MIFNIGEFGNEFYVIVKGSVSINLYSYEYISQEEEEL